MHIKQVTIQGFRSYKDQTAVEPFSRKHNVVVGKNGSGKSNFFKAIQFVLGDEEEFGRLGAETRQGLLHEGTGSRVRTAFCEIVFDNSDSRIPVDSEEVVLRRTVSAKEDSYTLNGKSVTKQDVANLLETAGFSKSNPYYIVKQGKVNELSTAAEGKRLQLLYEVAGTKVYDERRRESQEAMKDTADKTDQIDKSIETIEERLKTLEEEKEGLKKYQQLDKQRRMLEHTVFTKDRDEVRAKLVALELKREDKDSILKGLRMEMREYGDKIQKFEKELGEAKSRVSQLDEEKRQVLEELEGHLHRQTQLKLAIKDAVSENEQAKSTKEKLEWDLRDLDRKIEDTQLELQRLAPAYEAAVAAEDEAILKVQRMKQRRAALFEKQSRGDRFKTKDERDKFLNSELRRITVSLTEKQTAVKVVQKKLEEDRKMIKDLEKGVADLDQAVEKTSGQQRMDQKFFYEESLLKDGVTAAQKELWRKENSMQESLRLKKDELAKRESHLRSLMGRSVAQGVDALERIVSDWRDEKDADKLACVHGFRGMLIENIRCEEIVYTAVDSVAQNRLFNFVVTDDEIATRILDEFNRRKLPGEMTFLPLNRLSTRKPYFPDFGQDEVMPLLQKIDFEDEFAPAVNHVFGKKLVCRSLELAADISQRYRLDCVTPDGDTVDRRGLMTGGYVNRRESRMLIQNSITEMKAEIKKQDTDLAAVRMDLKQLEDELQQLNSSMSKNETQLQRGKIQNEKSKICLSGKKEQLRSLTTGIELKEKQIQSLETEASALDDSKKSMEREKGTELTSVLTAEEEQEVNEIDRQVRELAKEIHTLFEKRRRLEVKQTGLQSTLQDNLIRTRDEIQSNMQEWSSEDVGLKLLSLRRELTLVEQAVGKLGQRQAELDKQLGEWLEDRRRWSDKVEKVRARERQHQEKIICESKDLDKLISRLVLVQREKDDCLHRIRELVALPAGLDHSEYLSKSVQQLGLELDRVNGEMKQFGHVNQRAHDQFVTYSEQRAKLRARKEELDRGAQSIVDLMENLEHQKFDAIMLTFQQVTRNFEVVFKELVPQGRGHLTLLRGREESSLEETRPTLEDLKDFTGVGVKVTFTGGVGEMKDMHQLSGGQKTLVALATIFAIQRCDPAPFYLFDEVDQALDPDHRKSVGRMIEHLSQHAQFISTTFRAELLDHADKFYGVKYDPKTKISHIDVIQKIEAQNFIDDDGDNTRISDLNTTGYTASGVSADPDSNTRAPTAMSRSKTRTFVEPDEADVTGHRRLEEEMDVDAGDAEAEQVDMDS